MTKLEAIHDAQEKANLSKKNQVVFWYYQLGRDCVNATYDYTAESLWERRHFRVPITTKVVIVTPETPGPKKLQKI